MTTTVVAGIATTAVLALTLWRVVSDRRSDELAVPPGQRLPGPAWWPTLLVVGLADAVVGVAASPPIAVVGVLLAAVALIGLGATLMRPDPTPSRRVAALARRIRRTCGPAVRVTSLPVGAGRVRLIATDASGGAGHVDDLVHDIDEATTVVALVGADER